MNILIATPGRLLQHMDQTLSFDTSNLQLLVLDEADRILDMGFSKTLDAILANLPPSSIRQTLLFSATQTSNVQSLARLSLNEPVYVSVRDAEMASTSTSMEGEEKGSSSLETPKGLEQFYMIVDLDKKLDTLWSFVKSHLACKTLVFMSSGKQVGFASHAKGGLVGTTDSRIRSDSHTRRSAIYDLVFRSCTSTASKSSPKDSRSTPASCPLRNAFFSPQTSLLAAWIFLP
jgi:superfamily II DNA/RNA helicase